MKQSILTVILLLFVFVCFISMSALSGEDPWDADDHFSLSGNSSSSNSSSNYNAVYLNYLDSPFNIIFDLSFKVIMWRYNDDIVYDAEQRTEIESREFKKGTRH